MVKKYFQYIVLGATVAVSLGIGIFVLEEIQAYGTETNMNTNVYVNNVLPAQTGDAVLWDGESTTSYGSTINPLVGPSNTNIKVSVGIYDPNGDIPVVNALFYRSDLGTSCTINAMNCWNQVCDVSGSGQYFTADCTFEAPYYVDTTTTWTIGPNSSPALTYESAQWNTVISMYDGVGTTYVATPPYFEMGSVIGVDHPADFTIGQAKLGTETTAVLTNVTNYGNQRTDISFYEDAASDFACDGGETIPKEALAWYTSDVAFSSMLPVAESASGYVDWDQDKATPSGESIQNAYWKFKYQQPVGPGNCELNMTVYAVADVE